MNLSHFFLLDQYNKAYGLNTASSSKNSLSMVEMSYRANPAYGSALEKSLGDYMMYGIKEIAGISFDAYCEKTDWEIAILNRVCGQEFSARNKTTEKQANDLREGFKSSQRSHSTVGITRPPG